MPGWAFLPKIVISSESKLQKLPFNGAMFEKYGVLLLKLMLAFAAL